MQRILIAIDGSDHAAKVIDKGLVLAEALNAKVAILTVVGEYILSPRFSGHIKNEDWEKINSQLKEEAQELVAKAAEPFKEKGVSVEAKVVMGHKAPAEAICEFASEGNFDLIMVGSRGLRGVTEMFLGSVSNKVAHLGCTSVMIVK